MEASIPNHDEIIKQYDYSMMATIDTVTLATTVQPVLDE